MNEMDAPELWFMITCLLLLAAWIGAELFARMPGWMRRLHTHQRCRCQQAAEYAARQNPRNGTSGAIMRGDSTSS